MKAIKKLKRWWKRQNSFYVPKESDFPECNIVWAKNQKEYQSLPSFLNKHSEDRENASKYKIGLFLRIKLLFTGEFYIFQLLFGKSNLTPILPISSIDDYYVELPEEIVELRKLRIKNYKPPQPNKKWINETEAVIYDPKLENHGHEIEIKEVKSKTVRYQSKVNPNDHGWIFISSIRKHPMPRMKNPPPPPPKEHTK